jgi:DNA mismatch repair protein MutS
LQKIVKDKYYFKKESKTKCTISSDKLNKWINDLTKYQDSIKPEISNFYKLTIDRMYTRYSSMFKELCILIGDIDVLNSKAKTAISNGYCKPKAICSNEAYIHATDMRHAIIESLDTDCDYVPNNITLDSENTGILLYGVNGSGKSCYSKAVGLCIVLAQSGHFVPCNTFHFSPFTKLYTRITGDDNIFRGHSSFFVEMTELRSILNYCDDKSIVIGDEVCKGTEDVSAVAIVGTTIKHLLKQKTKFIFATHLHKLQHISILKDEPRLKIKHISVNFDEHTIFTRKLLDGTGDIVYGLEIAHSILKNESFHSMAFQLRNEILSKSSKLVADKKSKYNGQIYVNHCQICGEKESLESHHIVFQSQSPVRKDRKSNLVVLCGKHHQEVHSGKLIVSGWISTTDGKMLHYESKDFNN